MRPLCQHCDGRAASRKCPMRPMETHVACLVCRRCHANMTANAPPEPIPGAIPTAELSNADTRCIRCAPNDCTCRRNAS